LRFLCRNYFTFVDDFNKLHPRYRLCPVECEDGYNAKRFKKCDDCPVKDKEDLFKERVLETWKETGVRKYIFEQVLSFVYKAIRFKETPKESMTVYTHGIVSVYVSEDNLHKAKKDYEEAQKRKPAT